MPEALNIEVEATIYDSPGAYARSLADDGDFVSGEVFAKILADNDDNSRHGVVIPKASYGFFPDLPVPDIADNARVVFSACDTATKQVRDLSWIYYHRYPERRITRIAPLLDDRDHGRRLIIFTRIKHSSGKSVYFVDVALEHLDPRFAALVDLFFAEGVLRSPGAYALLPLDAPRFAADEHLVELLKRFDQVKAMGWVDSLRSGDTGIGYTFETLVGIEENNSQEADFRGIEIKCKLRNVLASSSGKINLFQCGPRWILPGPMLHRLGIIGAPNEEGVLSCYSQVTTTPNNKGLWLGPSSSRHALSVFKLEEILGQWDHKKLSKRLEMKHSRAVFIAAQSRRQGAP